MGGEARTGGTVGRGWAGRGRGLPLAALSPNVSTHLLQLERRHDDELGEIEATLPQSQSGHTDDGRDVTREGKGEG